MLYETKQKIIIILFFPLFNLIVLSLYILNFDLPETSVLLKLIFFIFFLTLLSIFTFHSKTIIFKSLYNFQISIFFIICLFFLLELVRKINPSLLPAQLTNYLSLEDFDKMRESKVEYLNESPYVKFKANTTIRSQHWRGSEDQFVYEWKTDKNGFKNLEEISNLDKVDIVALGNSFTEGMGVTTEKVWTSLLTLKGFSTYNLGVQGYAPIQLLGSLKKYGVQLRPNYVIIGYMLGTYDREQAFFDKKKVIEEKVFTGGIQSIARQEIRTQARYIFSALWLMTKETRFYTKNFIHEFFDNTILSDQKFNLYKKEIMFLKKTNISELALSNSDTWKSTLNSFEKIIDISYSIPAKVILLTFPDRRIVYFGRATGKELPENYSEKIELKLLREFANENKILFINLDNKLIDYVNNLENNFNVKLLPYLEIDGHLSNIGHEIVAEEIMEVIN